jgi:cyclase
MSRVAVIDSGVANLASVLSGFSALGADPFATRNPAEVRKATHVVLPGVGHFQAGIDALRLTGMDQAISDLHESGKPLLAVCLGMQLLGDGSEESPGVRGLGLFPGRFTRLPSTVRVPHLGWNRVDPGGGGAFPRGMAAFANSYGLKEAPQGWRAAWTVHGEPFVSALIRDRTLALQFHPELSGAFGMGLLQRWLAGEPLAAASPTRLDSPDGSPSSLADGGEARTWLAHRIIPCLDVRDGRVVKGVRFQNLRDTGDPAEQAELYERQGADEIVLLDVAASPEGRRTQLDTVRAVRRRLHIPLAVGGGVRTADDANALLNAGADKVGVNTAAVGNPGLIDRLADRFGSQCVVLAIDARRREVGWETLVKGGREPVGRDAVEWAREGARRGAGELLLTSWDRDGTRSGCDLELLAAVSGAVNIPVIASGGIGRSEDVVEALRSGADAVLAASIFHDGDLRVADVKEFLRSEGMVVRR